MKKNIKFVSFLLFVVMAAFLFSSCSDGVENSPAVLDSTKAFQLGSSNESYDTLQQAVQSLKDKSKAGAKVASESYTIRLNWDKTDSGATISEIDAEVKIDFQGHTLTLSDGSVGIVVANTGKAVEIANGTVQVARGATLKAGTTAVITASSDTTLSASVNASNTDADAITTTGGSFNIQGTAMITSREDKRTIVATETSVIKVSSSQVVLTGGMKIDGKADVDLGDAKLKLTQDIEKGDECKLEVKAENVEPQNDNVHQDKIEEARHNHSFSSVWTYDTTHHWHASTCGHNVVSEESEHSWNDGVETTAPTHAEEGVRTYTCTVCGATKTGPISVLADAHSYSEEWTTDATYHWHVATCGHEVIIGKAEHFWDDGTVTTKATHTTDGVRTYTCTVCGATKTGPIPALADEHTWVDDRVSIAPTHTENGERVLVCSVCNAEKTEIIPALVDEHFAEEWSHDNQYHWHAVICDHDVYPSYEEHTWEIKTVNKEPTFVDSGTKTLYCTSCLLEKSEIVPAIAGPHNSYHFDNLDSSSKEVYTQIVSELSNYESPVSVYDYDNKYSFSIILKALKAVFNDRPDLFWSGQQNMQIRHTAWYKYAISFDHGITDESTINQMKQAVSDRLAEIKEYVTATDDYGIAKMVYDYLVVNTSYDLRTSSDQTLYGIMYGQKGVCASYSRAYQYILQSYGIPCTFLEGTGITDNGSESHGWNAVKLDGSWYYVDVTWGHGYSSEGDSSTGDHYSGRGVDYTWFCRSGEYMDTTHIPSSDCISPEAPIDHPDGAVLRN